MKTGIMQPYFFPYIGYWQLINAVDVFVVYDNIKYTKKGWINRNRYLYEGQDKLFTLELEKASDFLNVCERKISDSFNKKKLLNQIAAAYKKAPFLKEIYGLFENIIMCEHDNLFEYIYNSILITMKALGIETKTTISSHIDIDHSLKSQDKVLAICEKLGAGSYINPIGGIELYDKNVFNSHNIELKFLRTKKISYEQNGGIFVPSLSILDVLMFNGKEKTKEFLDLFNLE